MSLKKTSATELAQYIGAFGAQKVVVVGDAVADQFLYGEISRVSREAPVLILRHERTETAPGGAANCASNLASLGARAVLVGIIGDDIAGEALIDRLRTAQVECKGILSSAGRRTTTKVRILAGQAHSTRQQVIRVDYEDAALNGDLPLNAALRECLIDEASSADAIIISDYNYGVVDDRMVNAIRGVAGERDIPVVVDSRFNLKRFPGFTSATPNEAEVEQLIAMPLSNSDRLESAGKDLREELNYTALLITRGNKGMVLFERGAEPLYIQAVGGSEPVDVTGAGDTVIAAYALALATGARFSEAAQIANHAGGLVVMKRGTASVNREELLSSIKQWT